MSFACASLSVVAEKFGMLVDGCAGATLARPRRNAMNAASVARFPLQLPTNALPVSPLYPWHA